MPVQTQCGQDIVIHSKIRRPEQSEQRSLCMGICHKEEQVHQVAHILAVIEITAVNHFDRHAGITQRFRQHAGIRHFAQQDGHIFIRNLLLPVEPLQFPGHQAGFALLGHSRLHVALDPEKLRSLRKEGFLPRPVPRGRKQLLLKRDEICARIISLSEDFPEKGIAETQNGCAGTEVHRQGDAFPLQPLLRWLRLFSRVLRRHDILLDFRKDGYIGAAETVNGLFGIAHDE